jgi:hypothetical protein
MWSGAQQEKQSATYRQVQHCVYIHVLIEDIRMTFYSDISKKKMTTPKFSHVQNDYMLAKWNGDWNYQSEEQQKTFITDYMADDVSKN